MSEDIRRGWTSASNALADSLCPGRHLAQQGIPEPPKSADASMGTRIHQALADSGNTELLSSLTLEEREVFDACRDIEKRTVSGYLGNTKEPVKVFRHQRSWCKIPKDITDPNPLEHSGECDVAYRCGNRVIIADYKTLAGEVQDSPRNLQLRDLAVLIRGALVTVTEVATVIIQPFVTHTPEVCVYTMEDLDKAQADMFARVIASNNPASGRVAGESQCQFCLAKTTCVQYQQWATQIIPLPALVSLVELPLTKWTPEQLAKAADALGPAQDFLDNLKAYLKEHVPPGWTLAPGNKRETITNPQECFTRFAKLGGTLEQFMACISVGKTKLKEQMNAVTGAKGMALDNAIKGLTEGIVEVSQNAPSLKKVKQ